MSLKMKFHSKWNVTQNGTLLKMEFHSKWNVTQNGISLKMKFYLKWNDIQNGVWRLFCLDLNFQPSGRQGVNFQLSYLSVYLGGHGYRKYEETFRTSRVPYQS